MRLLFSYLRRYWGIVILALVLAAINQIFSLLDPLIFRHIIDDYATKFREHTTREFFRGVGLLLAAAVGVAFVSRDGPTARRPQLGPEPQDQDPSKTDRGRDDGIGGRDDGVITEHRAREEPRPCRAGGRASDGDDGEDS